MVLTLFGIGPDKVPRPFRQWLPDKDSFLTLQAVRAGAFPFPFIQVVTLLATYVIVCLCAASRGSRDLESLGPCAARAVNVPTGLLAVI